MYIIADDLTGACATGALLSRAGMGAEVVLPRSGRASWVPGAGDVTEIPIYDIPLRMQQPTKAFADLLDFLRQMGRLPFGLRIDSTLRGPIGAMAAALLHFDPLVRVLVAPAFPESGRVTKNGRQFVHGRPLGETEAARDPFTPVWTDDVQDLVGRQSGEPVAHLPIETIRTGVGAVADFLARCPARVAVADAKTNEDLECVALAMRDSGAPHWVTADPGPLTVMRVLASRGETPRLIPASVADLDKPSFLEAPPILAVCGSLMPMAREQIGALAACPGVAFYELGLEDLAAGPDGWVERMASAPSPDKPVMAVCTTGDLLQEAARVDDHLSRLVDLLWQKTPYIGCFLSGGAVAVAVLSALDATRLRVLGEVMPLVAHSVIADGPFAGRHVVTKGGAAGDRSSIIRAVLSIVKYHQEWGGLH